MNEGRIMIIIVNISVDKLVGREERRKRNKKKTRIGGKRGKRMRQYCTKRTQKKERENNVKKRT